MDFCQKEIITWLRVLRSAHIGVITFWRLYEKSQNHEDFLTKAKTYLDAKGAVMAPQDGVEAEIELTLKNNVHLISYNNPAYPALLKMIGDPPPVLSVRGNVELLKCASKLAIVGARNASLVGKKIAHDLAQSGSKDSYCIVSGMARGIDCNAHLGALKEKGSTIAVLAGGVDQVYPKEAQRLYNEICQKGAVISEMPFGMFPSSAHFPRRNRIISGLSKAVVVVEAAKASGTLITARLAVEQAKDVFVVPGSSLDHRYEGSHDLLKNGAILTTCYEDIAEVIKDLKEGQGYKQKTQHLSLEEPSSSCLPFSDEDFSAQKDSLNKLLLSSLSKSISISIEELLTLHKVSLKELSAALFSLELEGRILKSCAGKYLLA